MWRVSRSIYIAESNDEAWDHVLNGTFKTSFDYLVGILTAAKFLSLLKADPDMPDEDVNTEYLLKKVCIIGDVKSCIRQLEEVWETSGGFGTLLMTSQGLGRQGQMAPLDGLVGHEGVARAADCGSQGSVSAFPP